MNDKLIEALELILIGHDGFHELTLESCQEIAREALGESDEVDKR